MAYTSLLDLPKKQLAVLRWLVENGPASEYEIGRKANENRFAAHQAPKALLKKGLLRFILKGKAKTGRTIKVYYPTFKGFLAYFASFLPRTLDFQKIQKYYMEPENQEALRKAILNVQKLYPEEKIFAEWNTIEKWLGKVRSYYEICLAATHTLSEHPIIKNLKDNTLQSIKNEKLREIEKMDTLLTNIMRKIMEKDAFWISSFEESFASLYTERILSNKALNDYMKGTITPIPNENLYNLFQKIIDSKIKKAEDRIQRLNSIKKAFKALFKSQKSLEFPNF